MSTSAKAAPSKAKRTAARGTPRSGVHVPAPSPRQLDDPELFINRELSLLDFQRRVLEEAQDGSNPLLERLMFLSFVGSNVDEFFMVRVAGLKRQIEKSVMDTGPDGMSAAEQLRAIRASVIRLYRGAHECWSKELVPALEGSGIRILDYANLTDEQRAVADSYFQEAVFPTLTPLAFDPGRPFPHISNLSLNLAVLLRAGEGEHFARVKIPDTLPQLVPVSVAPKAKGRAKTAIKEQNFVWLEQLVTANLGALFPGMEILEAHPFHVTRDADSEIQNLEAGDLLESVEEGVWQRRFADVVRVEINEAMPATVLDILVENLELERDDIYKLNGPLALVRVRHLCKLDRPDLKFPPFAPALPAALAKETEEEDIFATIRRGDILFHHPFDSFQPIVGLLQKAARDPNVLAIKITLYRIGRNAPVVDALLEAVENGKQVAVLLELKARFDEESNIGWARKLEEYGVHVVYGLLGLKVHCKAALIVRKEGDVIRRYAHLSTGNYNSVTAQL
jgi:polyphosphate kinase